MQYDIEIVLRDRDTAICGSSDGSHVESGGARRPHPRCDGNRDTRDPARFVAPRATHADGSATLLVCDRWRDVVGIGIGRGMGADRRRCRGADGDGLETPTASVVASTGGLDGMLWFSRAAARPPATTATPSLALSGPTAVQSVGLTAADRARGRRGRPDAATASCCGRARRTRCPAPEAQHRHARP